MARRKKQSGWLETVFGLFVLVLIVGAVLGDLGKGVAAIIGVFVTWGAILVAVSMAKDARLRKSRIDEIDKMDGATFERYLQAVFAGMGFSVEATPASGDFGADLVITIMGFAPLFRQNGVPKTLV